MPTWEQASWYVTVVGLPVAICALIFGWRQLRLARRAASVQTLVSINESFRQCWLAIREKEGDARAHALHDLLNLIEIACAALNDGVMAKRSGAVLEEFVFDQLHVLASNKETAALFGTAMGADTTFGEIERFARKHRAQMRARGAKLEAGKVATARADAAA